MRSDFQKAADLLDDVAVPNRYRSLRDAYRLRMLVLAHSPKLGLKIITAAQAYPWFQNPKSVGDRYARDYCQYIAAAVRGDVAERKRRAQELTGLSVKRIYRNSLRVTD